MNVVSKTLPTNGVFYSVNTPDYPTDDYWHNPVLPSVDKKYWKNNADTLAEMPQGEKDVVDAAEAEKLAKSTALEDIDNGEIAVANWRVASAIDAMSEADRKFIDKKLEDAFNSIYAGSLITACEILANDTTPAGALTQAIIDDLHTQIQTYCT